MGLTKEFNRYSSAGSCGVVASPTSNLVCIAPDVFAVGAAERVLLWNIRTAQKVGHCDGTSPVTVLAASSSRGQLGAGYWDGALKLFQLSSSSPEPSLVFAGHRSAVTALAFSADGLQLASGARDAVVIVWDVVGEAGLFRLNGHKGHITRLIFTAHTNCLISSSKDSFVKFWDLGSQHCFYTLADHRSEVWDVAVSEEDTRLITGSAEAELRIYQLQWKRDPHTPKEETDEVTATLKRLRTSPDDAANLNANEQGTDLLRVERVGVTLRKGKGRLTQLIHSPDGQLLLALGTGNPCDVYRLYTAEESRKRIQKKIRKRRKQKESEGVRVEEMVEEISKDVSTHIVRIADLFSPRGSKLKAIDFNRPTSSREPYKICGLLSTNELCEFNLQMTAEKEGKACVLEGRGVRMAGHRGEVKALAFSSDDQALLSAAQDSAKVWNRSSLEPVRTLEKPEESGKATAILSAVFLPGDRHCLLGRRDGSLEVWDIAAAEATHVLEEAHEGPVWGLRLAPDHKFAVSGSADKKVKLWNFVMLPSESNKNRKVLSLEHSGTLELTEEVLCLQLSKNGKFLAVGLLDNTARVYFVDTFKFFLSLYGHSLPVLCLDMSFDSSLVVTGSADKNVKIWGLDFGDCHRSLFAHDDSVTAVVFLDKTHLFFSSGKDGNIRQWDADKFVKIQELEGHHGEIWSLALSKKSQWLASSGRDLSLRLWEETEELVVLGEEEETERETAAAEEALLDQPDIVPGDAPGETGLAAKRTMDSVRGAENILEAARIRMDHLAAVQEDPNQPPHPMMLALKSSNPDRFVLDVIKRIRSSELERSLLLVPYSGAVEVMTALRGVVAGTETESGTGEGLEVACRVLFFLLRLHHHQLISSPVGAELLHHLAKDVPPKVAETRDRVGFNLAALSLLQQAVEDREEVQIFAEATSKLEKKKKEKKVKDTYIMTVS